MRSFLMLLITFVVVYVAAPWVTVLLLHWLPVDHPERLQTSVSILSSIVVYAFLRRHFGEELPHV